MPECAENNTRIAELQTWAGLFGEWHVVIEPGPIACADPALLAAFRAILDDALDLLDQIVSSHNQRITEPAP